MMTSGNGFIFRITGPLWGEFTGHRWIPLTKASDAELWWFHWSVPEQTVKQTFETPVIWDVIALIMTSLQNGSPSHGTRVGGMSHDSRHFAMSCSSDDHPSTYQLWRDICRSQRTTVFPQLSTELPTQHRVSLQYHGAPGLCKYLRVLHGLSLILLTCFNLNTSMHNQLHTL